MILGRLCVVGLAGLVAAQGPVETREITAATIPYSPRLPVSIKVDARLVEAPVIVRDGQGRAVAGLKKEDFEVRDDKKKRDISSFAVETPDRIVSPSANESVTADRAPAVAASPRPRFTVLLFDDLNSAAAELMSARAAAQRYLKEGLQPGERVSVFTTYGRQLVGFSTDIDKISGSLSKLAPHPVKAAHNGCPTISAYQAYLIANNLDPDVLAVKIDEAHRCGGMRPSRGGANSSDPAAQEVMAVAHSLWEEVRFTSKNTLEVIQAIVDYLVQFQGVRLIICASGGFLSGSLEHELDELVNRALHNGVVIDALDAKALYTQDPLVMGPGASARSLIMQSRLGTQPQESTNDALAALAYGSGGIFFHNNNDLTAGLREMMAPETTYLLGFVPDKIDGKYHHLKVRLTSGAHYDLQARAGYVATPAAPDAPSRKIDEAVLASDVRSDPAVEIRSLIHTGDDGVKSITAVLHLDLKHLPLVEKLGLRTGKVIFIALLSNENGNFVTGTESTIDFALQPATFKKYADGGVNAAATLSAPPGRYRLRGAVDVGNGVIATSTLDVDIP